MAIKAGIKFKTKARRKGAKAAPLKAAVYRRMVQVWKGATGAFIDEALNHIAVDTGMSAASLKPLASEIGMRASLTSQMRGLRTRQGLTDIDGTWQPNKTKGPQEGEAAGQSAYKLDFGTPNNQTFELIFQINVFQYMLHENGLVQHTSGPWNSIDFGRDEFIRYFRDHADKGMPDVAYYFLNGRIRNMRNA